MTGPARGLAHAVAQRARAIEPSALSEDTCAATQAHLLDCLGLTIAGRSSDRVRRALAVDAGPDPVVVLSLACGAVGLDDFDESTRTHPGAMIIPALLVAAAAGDQPIPGNRLATALALGYDLIAWLGAATDARKMHSRGRHPSAVLGVPSVALAAAWLAGLDEQALAAALGIGGAFSFGLTQFDSREDMRALQTAEAASAGLRAARFAAAGFPASDHALEGPGGLLDGDTSLVVPVEAIGATPGAVELVSFKPYPHFSDLHPVVAALLTAFEGESADPAEVVGLRALLTERAASRLHVEPVRSVKEAKRSGPFVLAFALRSMSTDGPDLRLPFTDSDVADPRTRALADRVEIAVTPTAGNGDRDVSAIEVVLADGRILSASSRGYPGDGRDPRLRWNLADVRERFDALTKHEKQCRAVVAAAGRLVDRLTTTEDVRDDARSLIDALVSADSRP